MRVIREEVHELLRSPGVGHGQTVSRLFQQECCAALTSDIT